MASEHDKSPRMLDSFDRAILRLVQADNKMPQRKIGEAVNLSPAAVQRRIAAMEASGVIARNVAIVDPDTVPLTITSIVEVQLINEHAPTVERARRMFLDTPEVQQCYYVTGGVSFMLVIVTSDMRAYSALTKALFAERDFIASYRSLIALDRVKAETTIIIP